MFFFFDSLVSRLIKWWRHLFFFLILCFCFLNRNHHCNTIHLNFKRDCKYYNKLWRHGYWMFDEGLLLLSLLSLCCVITTALLLNFLSHHSVTLLLTSKYFGMVCVCLYFTTGLAGIVFVYTTMLTFLLSLLFWILNCIMINVLDL